MQLKTVALSVKSAGPDDGLAEGEFLGYASVFGNKDSYGDVVVKGAFADTLGVWAKSGNTLPVLWGHDMADPFANIGAVIEAKEDDHGLLVKGRLDLENPKAKQVYRLIKGRRVSQMSFAYDVEEGSFIEKKDDAGHDDSYYELRKLKLYEVSVVPIGANQETEVLAVKAARVADAVKAGRVLSSKNEKALSDAYSQLTEAAKVIGDVLALVQSADPAEEGKASAEPSAKSEEPVGANDEEPAVESASAEDSEEEDDLDELEEIKLRLEALELVHSAEDSKEEIA